MRSGSLILHNRRIEDVSSEVPAQFLWRPQIGRAPNHSGKIDLHLSKSSKEAGHVPIFKFHKQIDVAVGPEPIRENRAEERKSADTVLPAEARQLLAWHFAKGIPKCA